jgi:guanine nucleotide-binding protein subunit alpha
LKAIDRVTQDDYTPSFEDTLWNYAKTTGIHEILLQGQITRYIPDSQEIKIVDIGGRRSERKKWIRAFDGVSTLFFFVDISGYDESLAEDQEANKMEESFLLFDSLCKSKSFANTPITIIFHFMDKLERKIAEGRYPSMDYESDKEDLCTVDGVRDYFTRRFLELDNRSVGISTSVHYTSIYDPDELGNIFLQHAHFEIPMHYA